MSTEPASTPLKLVASNPRRPRRVSVKIIAAASAVRPALDAVKSIFADADVSIVLNVLPGDQ
jgi:hypothetical protein